jgi:hypothetical protein
MVVEEKTDWKTEGLYMLNEYIYYLPISMFVSVLLIALMTFAQVPYIFFGIKTNMFFSFVGHTLTLPALTIGAMIGVLMLSRTIVIIGTFIEHSLRKIDPMQRKKCSR